MNWIDVIIILLLAVAFLCGLYAGFIKEVVSLLALIIGVWGALHFSSITSSKLSEWFDMSGRMLGVTSFVVTFVIIVFIIHFIGNVTDRLVSAISLGIFNRLLGGVFGVCKTVLFLSVIMFFLNIANARYSFLPKEIVSSSKLYTPIANVVPALFPTIIDSILEIPNNIELEDKTIETQQFNM